MPRDVVRWLFGAMVIAGGLGCQSKSTATPVTSADSVISSEKTEGSSTAAGTPKTQLPVRRRNLAPVEIGTDSSKGGSKSTSPSEHLNAIREALKPFQILLGSWKGLSQKTVSDQSAWAYDWVSDPKSPGLRMTSEKGVYVRDGRLSYLPESDQFEFTAVDADGIRRTFRGTFIEPIRDVAGDGKKLERTYKLQLTEPEPNTAGEQWRVTFNQQENNRYIFEVDRKRGNGSFSRVDTVHTQREGTSFALSETDYGDKTCIISQGLGTISVSYQGQSFWVCCSGCKSAFEEDPEKWIAKWETKKKSAGK